MNATENSLLTLTAEDLMSRDIEAIGAGMPLREAAMRLARREVHGAPVVDDAGRCVGVLSVTDIARWASKSGEPVVRSAPTCSYQKKSREPGGRETTACELADGACPFQRPQERSDKRLVLTCMEPYGVPTDWQVVELEALPGDAVRDFMTTTILTAEPTTPVPELARLMLEHRVHRLIVLGAGQRPVGVVSVDDLLQVLAHSELASSTECAQ